MIGLTVALWALGAFLSAYVLYQTALYVANAVIPDPRDRTPSRYRRLNVMVPAHDEERFLPRLLASLASQEYPKDSYRVTVIADNCTDGTVASCTPFDVDVLERADAARRGKGHAIGWALTQIDLARFDAVVIIDGDSQVEPAFLRHLNLQLDRGDRVIQCYNGVANPDRSWFTRLMHVSRTIANDILHPAKRKLGLSSYLMGNGMCFDVDVLRTHGWNAFSVGEDWEYYARLVLAGVDVGYSRLARVYHQESVNLKQASSQRLRWSGGRFQVLQLFGPALLRHGLRTGRFAYIDASLPLVFPNPSLGMNMTLLGVVLSALLWSLGGPAGFLGWFGLLVALQLAMFLVGAMFTDNKLTSAASLVAAPVFLAWKMAIDILSLCGFGRKEWKATDRQA